MARGKTIEEKLAALGELARGPLPENAAQELRKALAGASSVLAAKAAEIAAVRRLEALAPDLVQAFHRFLEDPVKTDRGCLAKTAIVEALNEIDFSSEEVFLRGIRHVQMEPSFGPPVDAADRLRGLCAFGLVRIGYPGAIFELVPLLMDAQAPARRAAAQALTALCSEESELLLRMKLLAGDSDGEVVGECFSGLMRVNPERSMAFVARFLESKNAWIAEGAAFALGESRKGEALAILRQNWENNFDPEFRKMLLLPIALVRSDEAFQFLAGLIENGHRTMAAAAVKAIKICASDEERREQVRQAVASRGDPALSAVHAEEFENRER